RLASGAAYVATASGGGVRIDQYAPSEISHGGLRLRVETGYPWTGTVRVRVLEGGAGRISLRVPVWASSATLTSSPGESRAVAPGYASAEREWRPGDELVLELPMEPRWTYPDRRGGALRGCGAVQRGPPGDGAAAAGGDAI